MAIGIGTLIVGIILVIGGVFLFFLGGNAPSYSIFITGGIVAIVGILAVIVGIAIVIVELLTPLLR